MLMKPKIFLSFILACLTGFTGVAIAAPVTGADRIQAK